MIPLIVEHHSSSLSSGNVLIQTNDVVNIEKLLSLHGRRLDGFVLSCWLMGHDHVETDHYNELFEPAFFEHQFMTAGK